MKNDGNIYTLKLKDMADADKFAVAEEFSEGSTALKELMLTLWNKGVETFACCRGHYKTARGKKYFVRPYISFSITILTENELTNFLKSIMSSGYSKNGLLDLSYSIDTFGENGAERNGVSIGLKRGNKAQIEEFFNFINTEIKSICNNEKSSCGKLTKYDEIILNACSKFKGLSLKKYYKNTPNDPLQQYKHIGIFKRYLNVYIQVLNNLDYIIHKERNEQGELVKAIKLAKGYYSVDNNKYYTLENGKIKEISKQEANNLKELVFDKKYNNVTKYSEERFNEILDEIKRFN